MTSITLCLPEEAIRFIGAQVSQGKYGDASAYIAELIEIDRRWQEHERPRIKRAAEEGLAQLERGEYFEFESTQEIMQFLEGRLEERIERRKGESGN